MKNKKRLKKLWAILSVDSDGNEGICVFDIMGPKVAVTGDEKNVKAFLELATSQNGKKELKAANMNVVLAEYERRSTKRI